MVNAMSKSLAQSLGGSEVEPVHEENHSPRTLSDSDENEAIEVFDGAVAAMMVDTRKIAKEVAFDLGMSKSLLSDFRTGARAVAFHRVVRVARKSKAAAHALAGFFADIAGYRLVKVRPTTKQEFRQQLAMDLLDNPDLLKPVIVRTASRYNMTPQEAVEFLDEPTDVRELAVTD